MFFREDKSKKGETLEELHKKQSEAESKLRGCKKRKRKIVTMSNQQKDGNENQGEDNSNYRKTKAEVDQLSREIKSLEGTAEDIGNRTSAERKLIELHLERDRLISEVYTNL